MNERERDDLRSLLPEAVPFERTTCACKECVQCCHEQPGSLVPGDLERIAEYLGQPVRVAALKFWASPGALLLNTLTGNQFRVGTITPRMVRGQCIFLKDDRCSIHEVAPAACAYFDTHMSIEEGQRRGRWIVMRQQHPEYQSRTRIADRSARQSATRSAHGGRAAGCAAS